MDRMMKLYSVFYIYYDHLKLLGIFDSMEKAGNRILEFKKNTTKIVYSIEIIETELNEFIRTDIN